jgi:hypothetical protein
VFVLGVIFEVCSLANADPRWTDSLSPCDQGIPSEARSFPTYPSSVGIYATYAGSTMWSGMVDIVVDSSYAYCVAWHGLLVVDVRDSTLPVLVGQAFLENGPATALVVDGPFAYVAVASAGVDVLDVSDPTDPLRVATVQTPSAAYGLAVSGSYLYVAFGRYSGESGVSIIDVSDPFTAAVVSTVPTPTEALKVAVRDGLAFVVDGDLVVVDVSQPAAPVVVAVYETPGYALDVACASNVAYIADHDIIIPAVKSRLLAIDVAVPSTPILLDSLDVTESASCVTVANERAFLGNGSNGMLLVDIADSSNLSPVGQYAASGWTSAIAVRDSLAFVVTYDVLTTESAGHSRALPRHELLLPGGTPGISTVPAPGDLHVVAVPVSASPSLVGIYVSPRYATDLTVQGDIACVTSRYGSDVNIVDLSVPSAPGTISTLSVPGVTSGAALVDSFDCRSRTRNLCCFNSGIAVSPLDGRSCR